MLVSRPRRVETLSMPSVVLDTLLCAVKKIIADLPGGCHERSYFENCYCSLRAGSS